MGPTLVAGKGTMDFVTDKQWWKDAVECCKRFAPRCYVPAGIMTAANIALLVAYNVIFSHLDALAETQKPTVISNVDTGILQLLGTLIVALLCSMGALIALVVAVCMWTERLHAFGRAFARRGATAAVPDFDEAQSFVKGNHKFLLVFWLVGSGYLLLPTLFMMAFTGAKLMMRPEFAVMFDVPFGLTRQQFALFCDGAGTLFVIVILAYSLVALVFGALANTGPARLATNLLLEILRHPVPPFALTVLVCLANALVVLPFTAAVFFFPSAQLESNTAYILLSQIWLGLTSTIVWPLSIAPFCKITRYAESD